MHCAELRLQLSFEGEFGVDDARRAAALLEGAVQGAQVSLDFTHCAQVNASSLAHLAETIEQRGGATRLLGLSRHDLRILRYLMEPKGDTPTPSGDVD
jgi:ABC-type transporter Mla MlaB component